MTSASWATALVSSSAVRFAAKRGNSCSAARTNRSARASRFAAEPSPSSTKASALSKAWVSSQANSDACEMHSARALGTMTALRASPPRRRTTTSAAPNIARAGAFSSARSIAAIIAKISLLLRLTPRRGARNGQRFSSAPRHGRQDPGSKRVDANSAFRRVVKVHGLRIRAHGEHDRRDRKPASDREIAAVEHALVPPTTTESSALDVSSFSSKRTRGTCFTARYPLLCRAQSELSGRAFVYTRRVRFLRWAGVLVALVSASCGGSNAVETKFARAPGEHIDVPDEVGVYSTDPGSDGLVGGPGSQSLAAEVTAELSKRGADGRARTARSRPVRRGSCAR